MAGEAYFSCHGAWVFTVWLCSPSLSLPVTVLGRHLWRLGLCLVHPFAPRKQLFQGCDGGHFYDFFAAFETVRKRTDASFCPARASGSADTGSQSPRNGPISAPVPGGRPASTMPRHFGASVGLPSPSLTRLLYPGLPKQREPLVWIKAPFKRMEQAIDGTVGSLKTANAAIDKGPSSTWFVVRAHLADCVSLKFSHLAEELEPKLSQLDAFIQLDFKESVFGWLGASSSASVFCKEEVRPSR